MPTRTPYLAGLAVATLLVLAGGAAAGGAGSAGAHDGRIAFHRHAGTGVADIYVVEPDGAGLRRLTATRNNFQPVWSPDGRKIASASDRAGGSGAPELYVMDADGKNVRRLTRSLRSATRWQSNYDAAWSPDGTRLAFVRRTVTGARDVADLYVMNADGSGLRRLTATPRAHEERPTWSPDGRTIAYARDGAVWTIAPNGTGARRLVAGGREPSFSPDGAKLTFSVGDGWIAVVGRDGRNRRNVVRGNGAPAWSPSGKRLVYQGLDGLYTVGADGTGRKRLTRPPQLRHDLAPSWAGLSR